MPQSLAQINVHIVFSTKDRKPWLHDGDLCDQLYAYMATILRDNVDSPAILIEPLVRLTGRKIMSTCWFDLAVNFPS